MRGILILLIVVVLVAIAAIHFGYLNVSQTKQGALPTVAIKGGTAPAFDVQAANVSMGEENKVVAMPTVKVEKPQ